MPDKIEVIELSSLLGDAEQIDKQIQRKKALNEWQLFAQRKRLEGLTFTEIARLWKKQKNEESSNKANSADAKNHAAD